MKKMLTLQLIFLIFLSINLFAQGPVITQQPHTKGVIAGSTAEFTVSATGSGLTYQWYQDDVVIGGATDSSYTTPPTTLASNGAEFKVIVSDGVNPDDTSDVAILYVTALGSRVTGGLTVFYNFNEGSGTTINDVSGFGDPLDLTINNPSNVSWTSAGLFAEDTALINSPVATKVIDAVTASNEVTIELWIRPVTLKLSQVFNLTDYNSEINFQTEQLTSNYNVRLRTSATNNLGNPGTYDTSSVVLRLTHFVFTFKDGITKIYRDGIELMSSNIGGDLSNWNNLARLSLGSELGGISPWKGIFYLAAVYRRALDSAEVYHNFTIPDETDYTPIITEQPQNKKVSEGTTARFTVGAIAVHQIDDASLSYQWQKNGVDISGATNRSYTTPVTTTTDSGDVFRVIVTNTSGSDTSQSATLEVIAGGMVGLPDGMTHYYKLEESAPPYIDSFGFTDATSSNPPASVTGIVGNAQDFFQQTVDVPEDDLSDWEPNGSFTLEFWMNTTDIPSANSVAVGRNDSSPVHWWAGLSPDGKALFQLKDKNNEGILIGDKNPVVNDGGWHLITAVRDGSSNKNYLYVDGNKVDSASQTYNASFEGSADINIGYLNLSPYYYFNGSLDEVALYNIALSQAEIQKHYDNGQKGNGYNEVIFAPYELSAEAEFNQVVVSWNDSSDNEDGFILERADLDSSPDFVVVDSLAAADTQYIDTNISDTTTYSYRIKAYNSLVESEYSNVDTVTSILSSIGTPGNLAAIQNTTDTTNVDLFWDDNSSNEDGFVIQRGLGDSVTVSVFVTIDSVAANVATYTDTTTSDTTTYTYRVYAFNADTVSEYSNLAEITTPVPVELTSFSANTVNGKVFISWKTATELNNAGFNLERSSDNIKFDALTFIKGRGTTTNTSEYSYTDNSALSGKYYYRLKQIDFSGAFSYSKTVEADLGLPKEFSLGQNYPNPFNPSTTIRFALPITAKVNIKLYNTLGQEVTNILNNELAAGIHEVMFNASNFSSGVYFYRLEAKGIDGSQFAETKRMLLIK